MGLIFYEFNCLFQMKQKKLKLKTHLLLVASRKNLLNYLILLKYEIHKICTKDNQASQLFNTMYCRTICINI